ncbi:cytochrome P450 [Actinomadura fibrosa]|uniref:Cytochrome P450 n=1 Tax=Actinomadura fibrosa TaxID=111802 RepID=A0ABW2XPL0_9ACTN|nr:cytochrome P450 [Actinomadura fibrosa]
MAQATAPMETEQPVPAAPGALPVLGHALPLLRAPLRFFTSLPELGELVQIKLGPQRAYVVCDPDLAQQILRNDRVFDKGGPLFDRLRDTLGSGLATCPHQQHRRQRRLAQPAFHRKRQSGYAAIMIKEITAVTGSWRQGQTVDVMAAMHAMTSTALAKTMFAGASLSETEHAEILEDVCTITRSATRRMLMPPAVARLPVLGNRRYERARVRLRRTVSRIITEYRESGVDHGDLLSTLLAADDPEAGESGRTLSEDELFDTVVTIFVAGFGTTAALIAWALYLVGGDPDIERRLHEEVDAVVTGAAAYDDLPGLELTHRILWEASRLYPPVWLVTRKTAGDARLGGHTVPADSTVIHCAYLVHHRPDLHSDPERFDPDRWRDHSVEQLGRTGVTPFGGGARKCIGDVFALNNAALALATIAAHWRMELPSKARVRPTPGATLIPHGLHMRVVRRSAARP